MPRTLARALLSMVVPPLCAACREPELSGAPVCERCRTALVPLADPRCRCCGAPAAVALPRCEECRGRSLAFERAWSAVAYEGRCRPLVAGLKFSGAPPVAGLMASAIARGAPPELLCGELVPVPAHRARRRRHGFNQAELIARALGRRMGLPVRPLLARARVRPQAGLERRQRVANARGSILIRPGAGAPPGHAVLVDDVYTTGATLDACARALREAGTIAVTALTFARALRS